MDAGFLNNLQLYPTMNFSGLVDENMLSNTLLTRPHETSNLLAYVLGNLDSEYASTLDLLTGGTGATELIENREYKWKLMVEHDHVPQIQKAMWNGSEIDYTSTTQTPGFGNTEITIWITEKWFGPGAVISFDKREYQVRVVEEAILDGGLWKYKVVMADGQYSSYVPPSQFQAGKKVSRDFSAYEDYSDQADIVNFQTPFELKNQLTTMRLSVPVTGAAAATRMVISMKDPATGKLTSMWSDMAFWNALRQWYKMRQMHFVYSKYNSKSDNTTDVKGANGRPVYIGAGLLEQIAPSHKRNYTTLTSDLLDDFLFDLSYNRLGSGQRKFVALGGEMAIREFDRVLKEKASGYSLIDTKFVTGNGQELTLGGQFTTYKMLNGIELTIKHLPALDSASHGRELHPISKRPLESYKMIFLDYGAKDGQQNIVKMARKGRENMLWYQCGSTVPAGISSSNLIRSSGIDGYSIDFLTEEGIKIVDPSRCGMLTCTAS